MKKLVSFLYDSARKLNDLETLSSLNPFRILKRLGNKILGRNLLKKIFFD